MTDKELRSFTPEEKKFYDHAVRGLPTVDGVNGDGIGLNGKPLPFGTGPHSVKCLRRLCEIVKPTSILEVGFNMGYSAAQFLELTPAIVTSIDISNKPETMQAASILYDRFGSRINVIICDSAKVLPKLAEQKFDMIFIDGGHLLHHVMADIKLALDLDIPYLAFDDIMPEYGPGVMPAINQHPGLEPVWSWGNIGLWKNAR